MIKQHFLDGKPLLPIEVKSGKNYKEHSALTNFLDDNEYNIHQAIVFSNEQEVYQQNGIRYMPIYYVMFLQQSPSDDVVIPPLDIPAEMR